MNNHRDRRDIDTTIGLLEAEGAQQQATSEDEHLEQLVLAPWQQVPGAVEDQVTYYGLPMLKPSVWSIDIPLYYFLGGTAGAALTLGAALQLASPRRQRGWRRISAICHWTGILGSTMGAGFLIHDLGRPSRFLYMMRVFRPTSPMNIGVWILSGAAPTAIATGWLVNRRGLLGRVGELAGYLSGVFGAALAGYTGVLVANTAIPVWQATRRWLPVLFAASSAASAASIIDLAFPSETAHRVTRIFGLAGRVTELVAAQQVERMASAIPKVGEPLRSGAASRCWKAASALTAASLLLSLVPGKAKRTRQAAGILGAAGSLCLRLAIHSIGNASARDPRASFQQQRAAGALER
jgi:formate-dependent nitrite reductase membrane component NrfD